MKCPLVLDRLMAIYSAFINAIKRIKLSIHEGRRIVAKVLIQKAVKVENEKDKLRICRVGEWKDAKSQHDVRDVGVE